EVMGCSVAIAFTSLRGAHCIHAVSQRLARLGKRRGDDRVRRFRFQFVESTSGDPGSIRHAADAGDSSDWPFNLGETSGPAALVDFRPMAHVWFTDRGNVDQRPHYLCISAARNCCLSVEFPKNGKCKSVVRLVAVACVSRDIPGLGNCRLALGPALLRTGYSPRISGPVR